MSEKINRPKVDSRLEQALYDGTTGKPLGSTIAGLGFGALLLSVAFGASQCDVVQEGEQETVSMSQSRD